MRSTRALPASLLLLPPPLLPLPLPLLLREETLRRGGSSPWRRQTGGCSFWACPTRPRRLRLLRRRRRQPRPQPGSLVSAAAAAEEEEAKPALLLPPPSPSRPPFWPSSPTRPAGNQARTSPQVRRMEMDVRRSRSRRSSGWAPARSTISAGAPAFLPCLLFRLLLRLLLLLLLRLLLPTTSTTQTASSPGRSLRGRAWRTRGTGAR